MLHDKLIFVVCSPRSGSTLLQRMLGSHSQVFTHPEPHLITPLNYLGYFDTVDKAPYDHVNAAKALREFCEELPGGEEDYLDAIRAYASTLYERVLAPSGKTHFLDKTPEYATVLGFLTKLYPRAKYVVLTRHPMAVLHSYAHSFFGGDYASGHAANPVVSRYVKAIGTFLVERPVPHVRVRYEDLVSSPETEMRRVLDHLELPYESGVIEYGRHKHISKSYGDPESVEKHERPVTDSLATWAEDMAAQPQVLSFARQIAEELDAEHLAAWGYDKSTLFDPVTRAAPTRTQKSGVSSYRFKRRILLALRKNIHQNRFGALVKSVRYYCDVLLRT